MSDRKVSSFIPKKVTASKPRDLFNTLKLPMFFLAINMSVAGSLYSPTVVDISPLQASETMKLSGRGNVSYTGNPTTKEIQFVSVNGTKYVPAAGDTFKMLNGQIVEVPVNRIKNGVIETPYIVRSFDGTGVSKTTPNSVMNSSGQH